MFSATSNANKYANGNNVMHQHGVPVTSSGNKYYATQQQQQQQQQKQQQQDDEEPQCTEQDWDNVPLKVIDNETKSVYTRGKLLGKGGFARCYLFHDEKNDVDVAGKVVLKKTLVKERTKRKLITEIKIHASLKHHNVVQFFKFFEDANCVYMMMELCESKSMMDLMKTRKRLTEPEVQFYMKQLIDGVIYLHKSLVIHRDLKLGNLFLTKDLQVKIGDFGLATRLDRKDERKVTICGTPNYLAPEILDGAKAGGHSFEVDIWSIGVILFTLLTGKPPFETSSVKTTYKKIRETSYEFPPNLKISESAKSLIKNILTRRPESRPTLEQIATHEFFRYPTPPPIALPISSLETAPEISSLVFPEPMKTITSSTQQENAGCMHPPTSTTKKQEGKENSAGDSNSGGNIVTSVAGAGGNHMMPGSATKGAPITSTGTATKTGTPMAAPSSVGNKQEQSSERDELKYLHDHIQARIPECALERKGTAYFGIYPNALHAKPAQHYLTKWVDYTSKYGMGYILSDGSVGVYFNDATKILLYPNGIEFDYYDRYNGLYVPTGATSSSSNALPASSSTAAMAMAMAATGITSVNNNNAGASTKKQTLKHYDAFLEKKVILLKHFRDYLSKHELQSANVVSENDFGQSLFNDAHDDKQQQAKHSNPYTATALSDTPIPFVRKWLKTKHAHFYRLSDGTVQVKFHDRSELIISSSRMLTFIDRKNQRDDIHLDVINVEERHDIGKRLKYLKDILHLLVEQSPSSAASQNAAPLMQVQQQQQQMKSQSTNPSSQSNQRHQYGVDNLKEPRADPFGMT